MLNRIMFNTANCRIMFVMFSFYGFCASWCNRTKLDKSATRNAE